MVLEAPRTVVVLDTNIVLDLLVFRDPACASLRQALHDGRLAWLASAAMRDELARVLGYPQIVPRLAFYELEAQAVLAEFDRHARIVGVAPAVPLLRCKDPDDQKFIDLAVAHRAWLLSKDSAVLRLAKRLLPLGVRVQKAFVS